MIKGEASLQQILRKKIAPFPEFLVLIFLYLSENNNSICLCWKYDKRAQRYIFIS